MSPTKKLNSSLILACGLALVALPCAFAGHDEHSSDAMFKSMDANSDGQISRAEHVAGGKKMFSDADANHDGRVTAAEMTAAHAKMKADMPAKADTAAKADKAAKGEMDAAEMIKMHDQNGDGQLTAAEHDAGCDSMFTKMDKNNDGSLSKDECKEGQKKMKHSS